MTSYRLFSPPPAPHTGVGMTLEFRTNLGKRVVVLGGTRLATLRDWLSELNAGTLMRQEAPADALLLDFRAQGFTPGPTEANALVSALARLCAMHFPPVAILTNAGAQYGGARMLCTLGGLRGCRAEAFRDEADAWQWLGRQLEPGDAPATESLSVSSGA
jgi:hypothetical protein